MPDFASRFSSSMRTVALGIGSPESEFVSLPESMTPVWAVGCAEYRRKRAATPIEILRASTVDPYGRTLGYVFLDGRNYSVMIVAARLAEESISQFGDNGFPKEAADVTAAARAAGPMAFESPSRYRARIRDLSRWLKARGNYPRPESQ